MASKAKQKEEAVEGLQKYVRERYNEAFDYRTSSGQYARMINVVKQMKGEPLTCKANPDGMPDLSLNLSKAISRGVAAMLKKPFGKVSGVPFVIKPTVLPELSDKGKDKVAELLAAELPALMDLAQQAPEAVDDLANSMHEAFKKEEQDEASVAAGKLQNKIVDQLTEGQFMDRLSEFLTTITQFQFGVLKIEWENKKTMKWNGNTIEPITDTVRVLRNISPFDFYPAPKASGFSQTNTTIERRTISTSALIQLGSSDGFDRDQIADVLTAYPKGLCEPIESNVNKDGDRVEGNFGNYDCLIMFDSIKGETLKGFGVSDIDPALNYEAEVWVIGKQVIRAALNEHPLGHRPYFGTSFSLNYDDIYGDSPVTDMYQLQLILNSLITSLVRNIGLTSGIQGEVDADRVETDEEMDDLCVITPNQIRPVKPDKSHGQPAYRFYTIPNISDQIMALIQNLSSYVYEILGIPKFAFGQTDQLGAVGRTSGGMAMAMNQASNTIYDALDNIERYVIDPIINEFVMYELLYGEDDTLKGDVKSYSVGLSGLLEKEAVGDKLQWLLQSLAPIMQITNPDGTPIISPEAPARILAKIMQDAGISTEGILPDFGLKDAVKSDGYQQSTPPMQAAPTDGRTSPDVAGAMGGIAGGGL